MVQPPGIPLRHEFDFVTGQRHIPDQESLLHVCVPT
jgi:hypothetical protein